MSERKPTGMSFESWIDRQVREATERGEFDNLPGKGKPIPNTGRAETAYDWVKKLAADGDVDVDALLPPALALAREVERLPARLDRERSEADVREAVLELNQRILAAHRAPQNGPPVRVRPVDVTEALAGWRSRRPA